MTRNSSTRLPVLSLPLARALSPCVYVYVPSALYLSLIEGMHRLSFLLRCILFLRQEGHH
jgi:hypothetical protein